jgi:hypothetical protein
MTGLVAGLSADGVAKMNNKTIDSISVEDIVSHPVWEFSNREPFSIAPVKGTPCTTLAGRIVGTQVVLADGDKVWALIGNIDLEKPLLTEHFITLSVFSNNQWFHLARYHDFDYKDRGPEQLSEFLGKPIKNLFPIYYDIRKTLKIELPAACGVIQKEPSEKLSREALIAMAVP